MAVLAAANAAYGEGDERELAAVLAAFSAAGPSAYGSTAVRVRPRAAQRGRTSGRFAVKCAAAFALAAGCAVTAAGAGMLPNPVQRLAHDVLGGVGVPAPGPRGGVLGAGASVSATALAPSAAASPTGVAALAPLCEAVAHDGNAWRAEMATGKQAVLVAAAGGEQNVVSYCARLLADSATATASPSAGDASATASPAATVTHGNGHATHTPSPNPHATGH